MKIAEKVGRRYDNISVGDRVYIGEFDEDGVIKQMKCGKKYVELDSGELALKVAPKLYYKANKIEDGFRINNRHVPRVTGDYIGKIEKEDRANYYYEYEPKPGIIKIEVKISSKKVICRYLNDLDTVDTSELKVENNDAAVSYGV